MRCCLAQPFSLMSLARSLGEFVAASTSALSALSARNGEQLVSEAV